MILVLVGPLPAPPAVVVVFAVVVVVVAGGSVVVWFVRLRCRRLRC